MKWNKLFWLLFALVVLPGLTSACKKPEPAKKKSSLSVTNLRFNPAIAEAGSPVSVKVDVRQITGKGSHSLALKVDGETETVKKVMPKGREVATVVFELNMDEGEHEVDVHGAKAKITVKKTVPRPTRRSAKAFAREYWRFMHDGNYEKVYSLLLRKDKKLIHKETFIHRNHQANEMTRLTAVADVALDGLNGVVDVAHEVVTDPVNDSTKTISDTFSIVSVDGRWHPKLDQADLYRYGAKAGDIGIGRASMRESFSIPSLSITVKSVVRDAAKKDPSGRDFTIVVLEVRNTGAQKMNFWPEDYVAAADGAQLIQAPLSDPKMEESIEIGPGSTAEVKVAFDISLAASGYSLLVGQDDDYYLIPLNK